MSTWNVTVPLEQWVDWLLGRDPLLADPSQLLFAADNLDAWAQDLAAEDLGSLAAEARHQAVRLRTGAALRVRLRDRVRLPAPPDNVIPFSRPAEGAGPHTS